MPNFGIPCPVHLPVHYKVKFLVFGKLKPAKLTKVKVYNIVAGLSAPRQNNTLIIAVQIP